ncbi:hypothetical protein [Micromonospora sp. CB01531]|uniref:hypothetical protein n=1 Tax=Micromonospora sp. CB01531 TaxID=1718947 RepID=UPI00093F3C4D|nr:hypothetical protein [Micromonospora sp. CB01531]OKI57913.1 hypothetical protein A6A27_06585 [Micromonospora sp. CB01531]
MRHRDWGGGEGSPRERQPTSPWDEPAESFPVPSSSAAPEHYRTPSRRRAIERGQQEPVDTYLPQWAVESGVRRADGRGRHAAPDDDDDVEPPYPADGWRADVGWRREAGRRGLPAIDAGPAGEHTAEWTLDTPQEQGYVGSRRAESTEDEPVSGPAVRSRPRRAQLRRPQVTSGLADSTTSGGEEARSDAGRSRRAASESWSRPAVDPWERGRSAEPDPVAPPAVDPWDASGVHAWGRSATSRWDQADDADRWDRTEHTGERDRLTDTGEWGRYAEVDQWDRTMPPKPVREGWASPEQAKGFWSGTRLAGDDPTGGGGSWHRRTEDNLLDPDTGGPVRSLVYTAACYLMPALLVFVGLLFLDGQAPAGCVTDITGGGCDSPRAHAFASLVAGAPRFGMALLSSLVVAVVLRGFGTTWRPGTVAPAAAAVGGLPTVMISVVTGQPIG